MTADATDPQLASQGRRLAGAVLDGLLFVLTLGIGWVIWYLFTARGGQSPAKRLLGMRVILDDGAVASRSWMLIRDLAVRVIAFGAVNRVLVAVLGADAGGAIYGLVFVVAALWCVWDADRQCLWDKIVRTRVVYGLRAPASASAGRRRILPDLRTRWDPLDASAYTCSESVRNLADPVGE